MVQIPIESTETLVTAIQIQIRSSARDSFLAKLTNDDNKVNFKNTMRARVCVLCSVLRVFVLCVVCCVLCVVCCVM
jgi:hypothetical protein